MALGWKRDYLRYKDFFLDIVAIYNNKPNLRIYLELMLSLSTIILFSIFAIRPTIITITELNKEITAKEETSTKLKQKVKNLISANVTLQNEVNSLSLLDEAVPHVANPERILSQIETYANTYSVQLVGVSISDVKLISDRKSESNKALETENIAKGANELPFSLSVSGRYEDIYAFLAAIENLKRPIKIDSLRVGSTVTENGKTIVLTISARAPYII